MASLEDRMRAAYEAHPLRESTILKRVERDKGHLRNVTELDLAVDPQTHVTDQNHVGELDAVVQIGLLAGVDQGSSVLDIGSGLGGPARALSYLYGCEALGVEITEARYRDSVRLTHITGLGHRASFVLGDFTKMDFRPREFDVVLGIDSLSHIADKTSLLAKCLTCCKPGGRVVIQEPQLGPRSVTPGNAKKFERLSTVWNVTLATEGEWRAALSVGVSILSDVDLTPLMKGYYEDLLASSARPGSTPVSPTELEAWTLADWAVSEGLIAYRRLVGRKQP